MAPHPTTASALFAPCFCAQISFKVSFFCSLILSLFATIIVTTIADSFRCFFLHTRLKDHHTLSCFTGLLSPVSCFLLMICLFMCTVKGSVSRSLVSITFCLFFMLKIVFSFSFFLGYLSLLSSLVDYAFLFLNWVIMLSCFLTGFPFLFSSFCFFGGV